MDTTHPIDRILKPSLLFNAGFARRDDMVNLAVELSKPASIRALAEALTQDEVTREQIAGRSLYHANGFYKIVLATAAQGQIRLHIWLPRRDERPHVLRPLENAHNHRWAFATAIITGCYGATHFEVTDGHSYSCYRYQPALGQCDYDLELLNRCSIEPSFEMTFLPRSSYWISPDVVHRASPWEQGDVTATVVVVGPRQRDATEVYVPRSSETPAVGEREHVPISSSDLAHAIALVEQAVDDK